MASRYAGTFSLADTNAHQLSALLATLLGANTPTNGCGLNIQADPTNGGSVYVGDCNVSSTQNGGVLAAGASYSEPDNGSVNGISTVDIYVRASAATQKINVMLRRN
jgi:hypothetical protein